MNGEKQDYGWIIKNRDWNLKVNENGKIVVTIIFKVDDLPDGTSKEEYADYFVRNYIKVTGTTKTSDMRNGEIVSNGKAELTLRENEERLQNVVVQRDNEYSSSNPNEKKYIIDIYNDTEFDLKNIRANVYLGENTKFLEASPSEIVCNNNDNVTVLFPFWINIPRNSKITVYLIVETEDKNYIPEIIAVATK